MTQKIDVEKWENPFRWGMPRQLYPLLVEKGQLTEKEIMELLTREQGIKFIRKCVFLKKARYDETKKILFVVVAR